MPGETIKCPHCECKVKISDVENEDGICPECGRPVMASSLQNDFDNDLDEEEYDVMDGEYSSDEDDWNADDDEEEQPDILDELNDDLDDIDEDGAPVKRRHSSGMGFRAPKSSPSPSAKRGKKK